MLNYIWPISIVILCNTMYQICSKSMPKDVDPLASLTVTYAVGTCFSALLYFLTNSGGNLLGEYKKLNWVPFIFGLTLVGLETGYIYAYKAGWQISKASIVQSAFVTVGLLFIGWFFYNEALTWNKLAGIAVCVAGLILLNLK